MRPSETPLLEITEFMPSYEDFHFVKVFHLLYRIKYVFRYKLTCTVERNEFLTVIFQ